ncbi:replication-associated recombination protein A [Actinospongicola halichondriae]|uniref:replication-associated recombination protein A n=1 Tax=Actinospongicola halichondriae TaxID=3236844 RepID=UPI003D53212C
MTPPPGDDLFAAAANQRLESRQPLAARLRPASLDDIVGQEHLLGPGKPLRTLVETDRLSSALFWGPPGTGKTTLARAVAAHTEKVFVQLSAVTATVKDVRETIATAKQRLGEQGRGTILFLDEIHRFNKAQQDALLPAVEDGLVVLVGATTENPYFEVNAPLRSRSTLFRLELLSTDALHDLLRRGLGAEGATATDEALVHLAERANGDGRQALTALEVAVALAKGGGRDEVRLDDAEAALGTNALRYGVDDHYDVISAFIKSIRGGDADAGLYWLARMVEAGEDARFIARRLVILASEDVGMADPMSLVVANAAAHAVDFVGFPEAGLNLAQAVVHLATAPKSNRSALGWWAAQSDVRDRPAGEVPAHLRDGHYQGAAALGHGKGYRYPHDDPRGWVEQQYLPDEVSDRTYYEPSEHGFEAEVRGRISRIAPRES